MDWDLRFTCFYRGLFSGKLGFDCDLAFIHTHTSNSSRLDCCLACLVLLPVFIIYFIIFFLYQFKPVKLFT